MNAEKLYTPQMLAAAVELAAYPPLHDASHHGTARSATCGSSLDLDLDLDELGGIARLGMKVRACAVGQAAATIFARHGTGRSAHDIAAALNRISAWLEGNGPMPDWPDIAMIAAARAFPARHGAMLLPWKAAMAALSCAREAS